MKVIYRMCGIASTNPSPVLQNYKDLLNELCLRSFVIGCGDLLPSVHFLCDFCPDSYTKMIEGIVPMSWLQSMTIEYTRIGINETAMRAYEIAQDVSDVVLFQECDYLYRPGSVKKLLRATQDLGLVSPYDHLNFYIDHTIHSETVGLKLVEDHHFRTAERNTMTFATRPDVFASGRDIFNRYGYLDNDVWHELRALGHQLYTPIPSFATHMVSGFMAPSVDWKSLWQMYL